AEKDNTSTPSAPPTYEEATSGGGMKSGVFPPPPSVPLHPSWAYCAVFCVVCIYGFPFLMHPSLSLLPPSAVFFVTYMILACCSGPSYYNTTSVLLCLGITALVCFSVTIFSLQSKFDFTSCQGVLFVMMMVLLFSGILLAVILPFKYSLMVCLASFFPQFLAFDTQLLMGNRRYSLSPEEYVFGALNIYLDIIYIFSFFLQIFGSSRD
uniref:Protein lifeguard 2 n=1 Tax=Sphenodon punctatus TaxID=8508 RepID=A0A8D0GQ95_SPHPU